jgi:hypothetical protein
MSFTVDDFGDLLRLLDQRPEWRAELRRRVLGDELMELPALMRQLAEQVAEAQAHADERLARLEKLGERLDLAIERLVDAVGLIDARVGRLEGDMLELRYARRAPAYLSPIARRLRVLETGPLADLLDDAVATDRLSDAERAAVLDADLVLSGRRREDGTEVYILAEVSAGIGPHDVERAADRATTLQKLGRPVIPIVVGWRINAEAAALADQRGVWHALNGRVAAPRPA